MADLKDIIGRTAANIGIETDELAAYADALCAIVEEARVRGDDVELMTLGTLRTADSEDPFHSHPSLLPPRDGGNR